MKKILVALIAANTILLLCLLYALTLNAEISESNHTQLFNNQADILTMLDTQMKCVK